MMMMTAMMMMTEKKKMMMSGMLLLLLKFLTTSSPFITTLQAGLQGIVMMETKHIFRITSNKSKSSTKNSQPPSDSVALVSVPKAGTIFHLVLPPGCLSAELVDRTSVTASPSVVVLLSGDQLVHRPVDRAARRWRRPQPKMSKLRATVPTSAELIASLLADPSTDCTIIHD